MKKPPELGERTTRKEYAKKLLEITSLGMVHAPEPARTERPCNAQGIEKRPPNCLPLVMGPNEPYTRGYSRLP